GRNAAQTLFSLVFLPYDAWISIDAIARTAVRMLWTRRRLLEWQTSSDAERNARADLGGFFQTMWFAPVLAVAVAAVLLLFRRDLLTSPAIAPLLAAWFVSPTVAWWLSRPIPPRRAQLSDEQVIFLRKL